MERVIDRAAYRRNTTATVKTIKRENLKHVEKRIKKFLYQLLISALIFLFLTIVKLYRIEPVLNYIDGITTYNLDIKELYECGENAIGKLNLFVQNLKNYNTNSENKDVNESNQIDENIISEGISEETKYEEAVEGVNQLIEDAEYIRANYKLKHSIIGTVTSEFGVRESENKIVTPYHSGIDVAANKGTNIYAAIDGEVITATTDNAYGKYIMIKTDNIVTLYAHCSELKVKKGQKVKQGELIGKVGSTGWATGPHLHFEIRLDGRLVNPADVLDYSQMGEK